MFEPPHLRFGDAEPPRAIDRLLRGYAAGTLDPYFHALTEAHLILSDENRAFVRALESERGDALEDAPPIPMKRAARDAVLAAIYAHGWYGRPRPPQIDPAMPEPVARLVGAPLDKLPWRFAAPGVKEHRVSKPGESVTALLYLVQPGRKVPSHSHSGLEATLVLKGSFSDQAGDYFRGDVAVADASVDHQPVADRNGPCVCFAVTEGPLRLTGPIGRIFQRIFGV